MAKRPNWEYLTAQSVRELMDGWGELPVEWGCCLETLSEKQRVWLGKQPVPEGAHREFTGSELSYAVQFLLPKRPAGLLPEFYPPDTGDDLPLSYRRHRFLRTVERMVPAVLQDLSSKFQAVKNARGVEVMREIVRDRWNEPGAILLGGQEELMEWAEGFHLNEDWVLRAADDTLTAWLGGVMVGRGATRWNLVHRIEESWEKSDDYLDFLRACRVDFQGSWLPVDRESRAFAELKLRFQFETALRHHLDRIEKLHKDRGYKRIREALTTETVYYLEEHCEWLALFQCAGKEPNEIAVSSPAKKQRFSEIYDEEGPERSLDYKKHRARTIRDGVRKLAKKIGLTLRA